MPDVRSSARYRPLTYDSKPIYDNSLFSNLCIILCVWFLACTDFKAVQTIESQSGNEWVWVCVHCKYSLNCQIIIISIFLIQEYTLNESFTDHSHTGNVKSLTISSRGVLASGSTDETIKLFNLKTRKEVGRLMHHEGMQVHFVWTYIDSQMHHFL